MIDNQCKICDKEFGSQESLFRHLRAHGTTVKEYILKWRYNGVIPLCACGCGGENNWNVALKDFTKFVHGHHAHGRVKSEDEKRKIGEKNSVNMKEWMSRHPDVARKRVQQMADNRTPETEERRIKSVCKTYEDMTPEDKEMFSDRAKKLWDIGVLSDAHSKATETFKRRSLNGEYDFVTRNDKISATVTQRYLDGGFEWCEGQYSSTKTGKVCNYRSSWELHLMKMIDKDPRVETWSYEPLSIPYILEGKSKRYIPDFHIVSSTGKDYLVEVKPSNLTQTSMNSAKRDAAQLFCEKLGWTYVEWNNEGEIDLD
jgi:hypothetical protein